MFAAVLAGPARSRAETPGSAEENREYALLTLPSKRVKGELTVEMKAPALRATEWIVVAPRLPELPSQAGVRSALFPNGKAEHDLSAAGRPILFARVPAQGSKYRDGIKIRAQYEATLMSRRLVRRRPGLPDTAAPTIDRKTKALALAPGHFLDFDSGDFKGWLDKHELRRRPDEGSVDFARRAFLAIERTFDYQFNDHLDRQASHVCASGKSDCGGLSVVFVSTLRANDIPARLLVGRWALSSREEAGREPEGQEHVKAEFFAEGVGWVPVDPAASIVHDKSPDGLRFFGNDPGDFLVMHLGNDLEIDTIHFGRKTVEWAQTPVYWVTGGGSFNGETTRVTWTVKSEPIELREATLRKPAARRETPKP